MPRIKGKANIFQNSSPSKDHLLSSGRTGISGLSYNFLITKSYVGIELAISKGDTQANKQNFDELKKFESEITNNFGDTLSWERLDNKKTSRVAYYLEGVSLFEKADWDKMTDFLVENMIKFEKNNETTFNKNETKIKLKRRYRIRTPAGNIGFVVGQMEVIGHL